ncbi:hypothetical protein JW906_07340, partial [bacterium]|nr:hypothetical protein [bacterium]
AVDRDGDGGGLITGGKMPVNVERAVLTMGKDLQFSEVLTGRVDRVVFRNADLVRKEYRFHYGELWACGRLAASGISSFAFEYRNRSGHLVDPARRSECEIADVSCIMGFDTDSGRVFSRIRVPVTRPAGRERDIHSLAFAGR